MPSIFRLSRLPRIMLLVLVLVLAAAVMIVRNLSTPTKDPRVDAIRAKGYPATLTELDASYKADTTGNAASLYMQAFAEPLFGTNLTDTFTASNWLPARGDPVEADNKAEFRAMLATNKEALELLYAAAAVPSCRYPVDLTQGYNTLLPYLSKIKRATAILSNEGLLSAEEGKGDEAMHAFLAASRVAESISEEPLFISQLVRYACWNLVCSRLERALGTTAFESNHLAQLQRMVAAGEKPHSLALGLNGERANGLAIFIDPRFQTGMFVLAGQPGNIKQSHRLQAQLMSGILKSTGIFSRDKAFFLDSMSNSIATAELPFPERWKQSQAAPAPIPSSRFLIFSRMLLPALSKAATRDAEHVARIRVTQTALAVERFRREHAARLPEDLEQLVPSVLPAVPTDPFDGAPVRFKTIARGYVVYSVGTDGKDDGGLELDPKNRSAGHDITFTVERQE